ncbi:dihydrolipoyl dehydrogenase [Pigmentiphaga litoralis]|uniref:dihydrolipoyl dehydrogenase n=1 Tax=Pigmentiphaga litoralis TaxID=516702 RepID=UPI00389A6AA8
MNSSHTHVDIVVIGAGTAGLTAFNEIKRSGRSVLLVDRGPLGTTCARVGCMPSKAALHAGHQANVLRHLAPDLPSQREVTDGLWRHARATRDKLAEGAAQRTRKGAGDCLIMGHARFVNPTTIDVDGRLISASAFIVATGSHPVVPDALKKLESRLLTTDTLFELETLPRRIGILGLGAIGLEMGLALTRLGVEVVSADVQESIAGIRDPEVNTRAKEHFAGELKMWLGAPVDTALEGDAVRMTCGANYADVDVLLAALGRKPNVGNLDLPSAGVQIDERGNPVIQERNLQSGSLPIFFAGDVVPARPLMHEAADEGLIAARAALQCLEGQIDADALPGRRIFISIVFSDPDVCAVGTPYDKLDMARTVIGTAQGSGNGRSRILGAEDNLVRIYADRDSGVLTGASLVASHGEHLAHLLAWAVQRKETLQGLLDMPFYHPSVEEMLQSALKDAETLRSAQ